MPKLQTAVEINCELGECPIWSKEDQSLYFVDILKPAIYKYSTADHKLSSHPVAEDIGCLALRKAGGFIAAMRSGIYLLDKEGQAIEQIFKNPTHPAKSRFNDGCVDHWGRFWCGTMWEEDECLEAKILRVDENMKVEVMAEGFNTVNGLAFSPDRKRVYYSDTPRQVIYFQNLDPESGQVSGPRQILRNFADTSPDGACFDAKGNYWSAQYGAGIIECLGPDGGTIARIKLPVSQPTMTAFGGPDLSTLFITSARQNLSEAELSRQPEAGNVFKFELGIVGLEVPRFAG